MAGEAPGHVQPAGVPRGRPNGRGGSAGGGSGERRDRLPAGTGYRSASARGRRGADPGARRPGSLLRRPPGLPAVRAEKARRPRPTAGHRAPGAGRAPRERPRLGQIAPSRRSRRPRGHSPGRRGRLPLEAAPAPHPLGSRHERGRAHRPSRHRRFRGPRHGVHGSGPGRPDGRDDFRRGAPLPQLRLGRRDVERGHGHRALHRPRRSRRAPGHPRPHGPGSLGQDRPGRGGSGHRGGPVRGPGGGGALRRGRLGPGPPLGAAVLRPGPAYGFG